MADDLFADTFNLEDSIYEKAYQEGYADGLRAGKIEGRTFGMAKGFDKFLESGCLFSKAVILGTRMNVNVSGRITPGEAFTSTSSSSSLNDSATTTNDTGKQLPGLSKNARLEKNIIALFDLMEPETLSSENTDEAVNEFDDRFKRAQGKAKIIDRILGDKTKSS